MKKLAGFQALVKTAAKKAGSQMELAKRIGLTTERVNRVIKHGDYSFNAENCLRLARFLGSSPSEALRLAGKSKAADLFESVYGRPLTGLDREQRAALDAMANNSQLRQVIRLWISRKTDTSWDELERRRRAAG